MRWIALGSLTGWAGIVALGWWLAQQRIELCHFETACTIRTTAARDAVLTSGLTVALVGLAGAALVASTRRQRLNAGRAPHAANPAGPAKLK